MRSNVIKIFFIVLKAIDSGKCIILNRVWHMMNKFILRQALPILFNCYNRTFTIHIMRVVSLHTFESSNDLSELLSYTLILY